jgi:HicB_like antitoxin of bacterial toxin-antitoxin system
MVDPALLDDKTERINITLPRRVLLRLDARAAGASRSGYIAHLMLGSGGMMRDVAVSTLRVASVTCNHPKLVNQFAEFWSIKTLIH